MAHPLVSGIRARLREMDEERDHLIALVALYENGAPKQNGKNGVSKPSRPFQPLVGGPTDRIVAVLTREGGLTYKDIVERALVGITSNATNPERSVGSTLQSLVKHGRIQRRNKRHFLVQDAVDPE